MPGPGKHAVSVQNTDRYEDQSLAYEACMRSYIAQAKNEIAQIKTNAEIAFHRVAEDANPRIIQINNDVTEALNEARKASGERDAAVNAVHSPLRADGLGPAESQPGGVLSPAAFQQNQPPQRGAKRDRERRAPSALARHAHRRGRSRCHHLPHAATAYGLAPDGPGNLQTEPRLG